MEKRILGWAFIFLILGFLLYAAIMSFFELGQGYTQGIWSRPSIWFGIIFWSIFGFFYYELKILGEKHGEINKWFGVLILFIMLVLYQLSSSKQSRELYEFSLPVILSPIISLLRGIIIEKRVV